MWDGTQYLAAYTVLGERAFLEDDPAAAGAHFQSAVAAAKVIPGRRFGPFAVDVAVANGLLAALHAQVLLGFPGEAQDLMAQVQSLPVMAGIRADERSLWQAYQDGFQRGLEEWKQAGPDPMDQARALRTLADATSPFGNRSVPAAYLGRGIHLLDLDPHAADPEPSRLRAAMLAQRARVSEGIGTPGQVAGRYDLATAAYRDLVDAFPEDPVIRRDLALAEGRRAAFVPDDHSDAAARREAVRIQLEGFRDQGLLDPVDLVVLYRLREREWSGPERTAASVEMGIGTQLGPLPRPWLRTGVRVGNWYMGVTHQP